MAPVNTGPASDALEVKGSFEIPSSWGKLRMSVIQEVGERRSQQIAKGYDADHDDEHADGSIGKAAIAYIGRAIGTSDAVAMYPWKDGFAPSGSSRKDLIDAAALCIAEVERLDRESERGRQGRLECEGEKSSIAEVQPSITHQVDPPNTAAASPRNASVVSLSTHRDRKEDAERARLFSEIVKLASHLKS